MTRPLAFLAALALVACDPGPSAAPTPVHVLQGNRAQPGAVYPLAASFSSALQCPVEQLTWSVAEGPTAGSVTSSGVFTAPTCGSPFVGAVVHVVADGCGRQGSAEIAVAEDLISAAIVFAVVTTDGVSCLAPNPVAVTATPGGTVQFYSRLSFTCRAVHVPPLPASWPAACP